MRSRRARAHRGFTLIEMMTVLAIVGILTLALAGVSADSGPGTPRTTAHEITGMVQMARLRAEARRSQHRVKFESGIASVWEATNPDDSPFVGFGVVTAPVVFKHVESLPMPSNVVLWAAETTVRSTAGQNPAQSSGLPIEITIYPDGSSTGGTVYLTDTSNSTGEHYRVFIYRLTGTALSREAW